MDQVEGGQSPLAKPRCRFSSADDATLMNLVDDAISQFGPDRIDWKDIGHVLSRTARQCRDRYRNYLSPDISTSPWSPEEDALLRGKVESLGSRWATMLRYFPGRTDVGLKNRWNLLRQRDIEVRDTAGSSAGQEQIERAMEISRPVHDYIGGVGESPVDWFSAVFTKDDLVTFIAENASDTLTGQGLCNYKR